MTDNLLLWMQVADFLLPFKIAVGVAIGFLIMDWLDDDNGPDCPV